MFFEYISKYVCAEEARLERISPWRLERISPFTTAPVAQAAPAETLIFEAITAIQTRLADIDARLSRIETHVTHGSQAQQSASQEAQ